MKKRIIGTVWVAAFFVSQFSLADQETIGVLKDNTLYEDGSGAISNGVGIHFCCRADRTHRWRCHPTRRHRI